MLFHKNLVDCRIFKMDDSSDGPGSVSDSLNGESKPDPAKLAQTAIIKQVSLSRKMN